MINQIIVQLRILFSTDCSIKNPCSEIYINIRQVCSEANSSNIELIIMLSCTMQTKFWDRI